MTTEHTTFRATPAAQGMEARTRTPRVALIAMMCVSLHLGAEPEIVIYPGGGESPWICFDVAGRQFGIWRATMNLYEADEHGAMGEDALDPNTLEPR